MVRLTTFWVLFVGLSISISAKTPVDSVISAKFQKLADRLRLRKPKLKEDEYEVRIWNKQGIVFGTAHTLYVLNKKQKALAATKYSIYWDRDEFRSANKAKPTVNISPELWGRLMRYGILTLPDEKAIYDRLHPRRVPRKDSTWTSVESDGSISVHAERMPAGDMIVGDGEDYYVEVFDTNGYRIYSYSNPRIYFKHKPDIVELQKMVAILDEMAALFR